MRRAAGVGLVLVVLLLSARAVRAETPAERAFAEGRTAASLGRAIEAEEAFRLAIELDPANVEAQVAWLEALIELDRTPEAVTGGAAAARRFPADERIHRLHAEALVALGRLKEAQDALAPVATLPDLSPETKSWLGYVLFRSGRQREGLGPQREALEALSGLPRALALGRLSECLAIQERRAEAADALIEAVRLDPENGEAWKRLAELWFRGRQWGEAETAAERAMDLLASDPEAVTLRALAREERDPSPANRVEASLAMLRGGRYEAGATIARALCSEVPAGFDADVAFDFATELAKLGLDELAYEAASAALSLGPAKELDERGRVLLAETLLRMGYADRAIEEAKRAGPAGSAVAAAAEARRREWAARPTTDAIDAARKAREAAPKDARANNDLAIALYREKRYDEAEYYSREAVALLPANAILSGNLGEILRNAGKPRAAGLRTEAAVRLSPAEPRFRNDLGLVLYSLGLFDAAADSFEEARKRSLSASHAANRGDALMKARRRGEAEQALLFAVTADSGEDRAQNLLGNLYHDQRRYAEAAARYEAAIAAKPDHATYHANLAGALLRLGRRDEALAAGKKAVELGSTADRHWALRELGL